MIKQAEKSDAKALATLAAQLYHTPTAELEKEFAALIESPAAACFIKYADSTPAGFAQCQLRTDYVEGTTTSPVGYLEGIYVAEKYRNNGFAKELLHACENWAKDQNCTEFASDCELDNTASLNFHLSMGFEEANRVICFTKKL